MPKTTYKYTTTDKMIWVATWLYLVSFNVFYASSMSGPLMMLISLFVLVNSNFKMEIFHYHLMTLQWCLYVFATSFWAINGRYSIKVGITILQALISIYIFYEYYRKLPDIRILLRIVMWSGYFIVFYTYFFYGITNILDSESSERLQNEFSNVNTIAMVTSTAMILHFYFVFFEKTSRWQMIAMYIPSVMVIGATQSRKAIVLLLFGIGLLYYFKTTVGKRKDNLLPFLKLLGFVAVIVIILFALVESGLFAGLASRMEGLIATITGEGDADSSAAVRKMYRKIGWIQFSRTPILGVGMNNTVILASRALSKGTYLHCNYAELAAGGGTIGLISYYSIFLYVVYHEAKYIKVDSSAVLMLVWVTMRFVTDWGAVSYYGKITFFYAMVFYLHVSLMKRKYPEISKRRRRGGLWG